MGLSDKDGGHTVAMMQGRFSAGIEDVAILPLVTVAVGAKTLLKNAFSILIHILDYIFPILLQLARFPLFTARIIGDALTAFLKVIVGCLPVSGMKREEWRESLSRHWSWLRRKISYQAFEEAVHHAFEGGMAWVFRRCRTLTPLTALLVIACAVLWIPISFAVATALHAVLFAKAASLPAWMQLLHPVATVIAKSKLLVLPAYPAAWPQARKHTFVQTMYRFYWYLTGLHLTRKTAFRYRQMDHARTVAADALGRAASRVGLSHLAHTLSAGFNRLSAWIGKAWRPAMTRVLHGASRLPLIGSMIGSYAAHYEAANQQPAQPLSKSVSGFFGRWSIKFSAEYYEAKEREEAAKEASQRESLHDPPLGRSPPATPG